MQYFVVPKYLYIFAKQTNQKTNKMKRIVTVQKWYNGGYCAVITCYNSENLFDNVTNIKTGITKKKAQIIANSYNEQLKKHGLLFELA